MLRRKFSSEVSTLGFILQTSVSSPTSMRFLRSGVLHVWPRRTSLRTKLADGVMSVCGVDGFGVACSPSLPFKHDFCGVCPEETSPCCLEAYGPMIWRLGFAVAKIKMPELYASIVSLPAVKYKSPSPTSSRLNATSVVADIIWLNEAGV